MDVCRTKLTQAGTNTHPSQQPVLPSSFHALTADAVLPNRPVLWILCQPARQRMCSNSRLGIIETCRHDAPRTVISQACTQMNACREEEGTARVKEEGRVVVVVLGRVHSPLEPHKEPHRRTWAWPFCRTGTFRGRAAKRCAPVDAPYQIKGSVGGRRGSRIGRPIRGVGRSGRASSLR